MEGLLNFIKTPEGQGLLSAAFGGLAGARRGQPINSLGRAGLAGLGGYSGAQDRAVQLADSTIKRGYMQSQIDENTSQIADRRAKLDDLARVRGLIANFGLPQPGMGATNQVESALPPHLQIPAQPKIGAQNVDYTSLIRQGVPLEQVKALADSVNFGRPEVARTMKGIGADGREYENQFDKFGTLVGMGQAQYKAPISINQGDRTTFADAYNFKPVGEFRTNQSPDSKASNSVTMRGQNMTNEIAREKLAWEKGGGSDGVGESQTGLAKQFGKPSPGYRWTTDGKLEFIPGGPADQKAQLKTSGEGTVDSVVADIRDKYSQLQTGGGITDTQNGGLSNLGAGIQSSGVGQAAGKLFGTQNQSQRNNIAMSRPLLLQAIMKATGMSAKQMDSNAELKLYLATATDPTLDLQANMLALDRIEKLYGSGQKGGADAAKDKPPSQSFDSKPPAQQYKGKTMTGPDGKRYQSDGMIWKAVQ